MTAFRKLNLKVCTRSESLQSALLRPSIELAGELAGILAHAQTMNARSDYATGSSLTRIIRTQTPNNVASNAFQTKLPCDCQRFDNV